jgi:DNA-binding transcriptional ArsR family regulator
LLRDNAHYTLLSLVRLKELNLLYIVGNGNTMASRPRARKKGNYGTEILHCLEESVMGLTVTDLANTLGMSRNTVSKYLGIYEAQQLITKQEIGAYRLYFGKNRGALPNSTINSLFLGFLAGIKREFPYQAEAFKRVGAEIDKHITFPLIGGKVDEIITWIHNLPNETFLESIAFLLPRIFFIAEKAIVKSYVIQEGGNKATYVLTDTPLLSNENYIYGFHAMAGFLESYFKSKYQKSLKCDVGECHFSQVPSEAYANVSITIVE